MPGAAYREAPPRAQATTTPCLWEDRPYFITRRSSTEYPSAPRRLALLCGPPAEAGNRGGGATRQAVNTDSATASWCPQRCGRCLAEAARSHGVVGVCGDHLVAAAVGGGTLVGQAVKARIPSTAASEDTWARASIVHRVPRKRVRVNSSPASAMAVLPASPIRMLWNATQAGPLLADGRRVANRPRPAAPSDSVSP